MAVSKAKFPPSQSSLTSSFPSEYWSALWPCRSLMTHTWHPHPLVVLSPGDSEFGQVTCFMPAETLKSACTLRLLLLECSFLEASCYAVKKPARDGWALKGHMEEVCGVWESILDVSVPTKLPAQQNRINNFSYIMPGRKITRRSPVNHTFMRNNKLLFV